MWMHGNLSYGHLLRKPWRLLQLDMIDHVQVFAWNQQILPLLSLKSLTFHLLVTFDKRVRQIVGEGWPHWLTCANHWLSLGEWDASVPLLHNKYTSHYHATEVSSTVCGSPAWSKTAKRGRVYMAAGLGAWVGGSWQDECHKASMMRSVCKENCNSWTVFCMNRPGKYN